MASNPYQSLPERAFWKPAVAARHIADLADLWDPMPLAANHRIATAGSCFAQHIGRHLRARGLAYMDLEPTPPIFRDTAEANRHGYGIYSCRYGNIYTTRQLSQLVAEAFGDRVPAERVWTREARFYDALRPSVDPVGHDSAETVLTLRTAHLAAVRRLFETLDVFVFTLGLTETWEHADGTVYPSAPGVICGDFVRGACRFRNLRYTDMRADIEAVFDRIRSINPGARLLLTVSPVPLTATASDDHVLVASTRSKSVLRAVAGDLAADHPAIHYFPSYEIIAAHPARAMFFNPDLRSVNDFGVAEVMRHFFTGPNARFSATGASPEEEHALICDEERIEPA
jgi:hypothetical protein